MNTTVIGNESSQTPIKTSFLNEVLFFAKSGVVMAAIVLFVASAWV